MNARQPGARGARPAGTADLAVRVLRVPGGRRRLARDLARLADRAALLARRDVALAYAVIDDPAMARLHERHLGLAGPTDVLAFPLSDAPVLVGDVVVSLDTARREASSRGHPAYDELLLYAVHGTLHLLGHDDHDAPARRRMRRAEQEALAALGRPCVFARPPRRRSTP